MENARDLTDPAHRSRRRRALVGAVLLALGAARPLAAATFTWIGPGGTTSVPTSGSWSSAANWSGSTLPVSASTTTLTFGGGIVGARYTATDDIIPAPFDLNTLNVSNLGGQGVSEVAGTP